MESANQPASPTSDAPAPAEAPAAVQPPPVGATANQPASPTAAVQTGSAEESGELQMHPVKLTAKNIKFIPGPVKGRMSVLRAWCKENCKGKYQALAGGFDWLFTNPADAEAFGEAWNSRKEAEKKETLEGVTDE